MKIQLQDVQKMETLVKKKRKLEVAIEGAKNQEDVKALETIKKEMTSLREREKDLSIKHYAKLTPEYLEEL